MGTRAGLEYPEGDAENLAAAADGLWSLAATVADAASSVARAGTVAEWRGKSATMFAAVAEQLSRPLADSTEVLHRAGRAVADLAEEIAQAQRRIRGWAEEIEEAERQAESARAALLQTGFPTRLLADPLEYFGRHPDPRQQRYDRADERVAELRARYQPKARQLCEQIADEDRRVSEMVVAAVDAAPAGGARVPGAPDVPILVRLNAPRIEFTPTERYLPADPRVEFEVPDSILSADHLHRYDKYLSGQGAGAPTFYRERWFGDEKVIEYWSYRRHNSFRNLPFGGHPDDSEGFAVLFRDGRPVRHGYTQHGGGCSLPLVATPIEDGKASLQSAEGSGALYPFRGHDDRVFGPLDELWGPAKGEETPPDHILYTEDNLVPYEGHDWRLLDPGNPRLPDNDHNSKLFERNSPVWDEQCEPLPPRE